ncbi:uncharacterized protein RCC_02743 [Ramularia collo-cygni]|uniref:Uncharacterized protein n=1 Tax=Ramularia collo-cygni TaxID=112498 RepID=A0A2D3V602_9PEZI|nr:uncharacterized protein RCC_02743 [Ramularia collo-cygni]CZT16909.1 uncharacterized protein RCC_02743 [Ramularia collo-cygni]
MPVSDNTRFVKLRRPAVFKAKAEEVEKKPTPRELAAAEAEMNELIEKYVREASVPIMKFESDEE